MAFSIVAVRAKRLAVTANKCVNSTSALQPLEKHLTKHRRFGIPADSSFRCADVCWDVFGDRPFAAIQNHFLENGVNETHHVAVAAADGPTVSPPP